MSYRRNSSSVLNVIWFIIIAIVLVICLCEPLNKVTNQRDVVVTVTDKDIKNDSRSSKYLVFVEDENGNPATYEITDSLFLGRFDSSDVYAAIEPGEKYQFTVRGSRNEFLSWYPNIYEYKLIEDN